MVSTFVQDPSRGESAPDGVTWVRRTRRLSGVWVSVLSFEHVFEEDAHGWCVVVARRAGFPVAAVGRPRGGAGLGAAGTRGGTPSCVRPGRGPPRAGRRAAPGRP